MPGPIAVTPQLHRVLRLRPNDVSERVSHAEDRGTAETNSGDALSRREQGGCFRAVETSLTVLETIWNDRPAVSQSRHGLFRKSLKPLGIRAKRVRPVRADNMMAGRSSALTPNVPGCSRPCASLTTFA